MFIGLEELKLNMMRDINHRKTFSKLSLLVEIEKFQNAFFAGVAKALEAA